jgi:hypothetical protein
MKREYGLSLIGMFSCKDNICPSRLAPLPQVLPWGNYVFLPTHGIGVKEDAIAREPEAMAKVEVFVSKGAVTVECGIKSPEPIKDLT